MRLSNKAEYGMRALLDMALHRDHPLVPIADIAERTGIPLKFLEQILLALKAAGMVDSKRGVGGGYYLARSPEAITVADVLKVLDGPVQPINCEGHAMRNCPDQEACSIRSVWIEASDAMARVLDRTSFADLALRSQHLLAKHGGPMMYHI